MDSNGININVISGVSHQKEGTENNNNITIRHNITEENIMALSSISSSSSNNNRSSNSRGIVRNNTNNNNNNIIGGGGSSVDSSNNSNNNYAPPHYNFLVGISRFHKAAAARCASCAGGENCPGISAGAISGLGSAATNQSGIAPTHNSGNSSTFIPDDTPTLIPPTSNPTLIDHSQSSRLSYASTLELLECSVCFDCMTPPIYQCKEGHVLCNECTTKVAHCPICRSQPIDIRCRALEKLSESLPEHPCKYSHLGCINLVKYSCKKQHEAKCSMRPFQCLHNQNGCLFEGSSEDLVSHLLNQHDYELQETNQIKFICERPNVLQYHGDDGEHYIWQKHIYSCYNKHYVLRIHRKVDYDPHFYFSVVALHNKHHPNRYCISVFGNHRIYTFEGPIWSIRKGISEMERVRDCLILPENIAFFLSGGKGSENSIYIIRLVVMGEIMAP